MSWQAALAAMQESKNQAPGSGSTTAPATGSSGGDSRSPLPSTPTAVVVSPTVGASVAPKPSVASMQSSNSSSLAPYGGIVTTKPSFASIPESTTGLLGHGAPFAGRDGAVTTKPSLASLPEKSPLPQPTPAVSHPAPPPPPPPPASQPPPKPAVTAPPAAKSKTDQWRTTPLTKKEEYKKKLSNFIRIFTFSKWTDRMVLVGASVSAIASGCTLPLMNIVFGRLVTTVTGNYTPDMTATQVQDSFTQTINECVLYMVYLFIGRLVLGYLATLGFRMISLRISAAMRLAYMRSLLNQPISSLDAIPPGQTASIITNTANTMQLGISEKLALFISGISLVISAMVIAFIFNWKLTLVTSSGLVVIGICYGVTIPLVVKKMKQVEESEIGASAVAAEAFSTVRMIAACGAESKMSARYRYWAEESRRRGLSMSKFVAVQQAIVFFTVYATFALTFWFAIKLYMNFEIPDVGALIIVLMSVMMIVMSIGTIASPLSAAARSASSADLLFAMIDLPARDTRGSKAPDVSAAEEITMENVNFTYPTRPDMKVLAGLNVTFPAGKITAIVGPSGSGKSTIVGLLQRWYELDGDFGANLTTLFFRNGQIKVGGHPLKEVDLKWWRSQIGLVQQEPFLFNDTLLKNVEYGLIGTEWEKSPKDEKKALVEQACKEAFADEFIDRLPEGYETRVGDAGIKLSGGQRQRIAIARAIVKRPKILILDEATSAIDVRSEELVQAALDRVSAGRTTITIAHRLSTVRKADNIVVLAKGQAVQQGTHEALMAQPGGAYWTLATSQQLVMEEDDEDSFGSFEFEKGPSVELMDFGEYTASTTSKSDEPAPYVKRGFFGSFGSLIVEQGKHWKWYVMLLFGAVIAGASSPAQAFLFAELISGFYLWGDYLRDWINFWCLMFTALACGVGLGYFALGWSATTLAFHITAVYRQEYFNNIISKTVAFFDEERHSVGGLTAVVASDPTQLQQLLGTNMGFALISVLNVVGCLAISFYFGWKLSLVALSSSLPIVLAAGFFRIRYETQFEATNKEVFAESAKFATESVGACRTVAALTLEGNIVDKYDALLREHVKGAFKGARFSTLIFAGSDSLPLLCMAFVLWYGGKLLATQEYYPFQYLVVYIAVVQGGIGAGQWLSFGPNIAQATASANRILSMRRKDNPGKKYLPLESTGVNEDEKGVKIEFNHVWFRYPTRDAPVLNGLNLTIEKGQFAAIVGASGAGKTSVVSLIERFYTPKSGSITYNGIDINDTDLAEYRASISLVAQEASLFTGTIRQNVLAGVDEAAISEERLHQACRDAEIHDFIVSLPSGYNTMIGLMGVLLSGGQRQRLAIARALVRNPRLLLLDEATSSLDSETERQVQKVFERTKEGRTMIVVAHRLATVQNADVIFVLGDGVVLEKGNHAALLARKGVYYNMCLSQALDR